MPIEFIYGKGAAKLDAPVAALSGDMVLVGGLLPFDRQGILVAESVRKQAAWLFEQLAEILGQAGASIADVVKTNVYFPAADDDQLIESIISDIDAVRASWFAPPFPVTTELRCELERPGARLMIDAWAVVGGDRQIISPQDHWSWASQRPWSQGVKVGNRLFVGAQRPLDAHGKVIGRGDIEKQTDAAFGALDHMLLAAGGTRNNLMRQNTFFRYSGSGEAVTEFWEKMTAVRRRYMSSPSAAGAGLRVIGPGLSDELIQVEGIAVLGDDKQRLQPSGHWDWSIAGNSFTQGWLIDGMAFIGGQISADSSARAVGDTLEQQTRNVFEFVRRTLNEGGLTESHVAKLYIYYSTHGDRKSPTEARETIRRVQEEFYPAPGPVVSAICVEGFAFEDLLVEIEAFGFAPIDQGLQPPAS